MENITHETAIEMLNACGFYPAKNQPKWSDEWEPGMIRFSLPDAKYPPDYFDLDAFNPIVLTRFAKDLYDKAHWRGRNEGEEQAQDHIVRVVLKASNVRSAVQYEAGSDFVETEIKRWN